MTTIITLVLAGALLIMLLAPDDYATFGNALWFTLQMVTTVGFGHNTPTSGVGRFVASIVMLVSIGLITVITAGITSMSIRSVSQVQEQAEQPVIAESLARIEAALASAHERLDQLDKSSSTAHTDG